MDYSLIEKHNLAPNVDPFATLEIHTNSVESVQFSPVNPNLLCSGSFDHTFAFWDIPSLKCTKRVTAHSKGLWSIQFSKDGKKLITGSADNTIKIWDTSNFKETATLTGHKDHVSCVRYNPDNTHIASVGYDGTMKIWDTRNGKILQDYTSNAKLTESLEYSQDGKYLFMTTSNSDLICFSTVNYKEICRVRPNLPNDTEVRAFGISFDFIRDKGSKKQIFVAYSDCNFRRFNFTGTSFETVHEEWAHSNYCKGIFTNWSIDRMISCSKDGGAKLWRLSDNELLATYCGCRDATSCVAYPTEEKPKFAAISSWDQTVRLFNIEY